MTRNRTLFGRLAGACLVAAFCVGAAQGAVYDETTGYVRLLKSGSSASIFPLSTNQVFDADGTVTLLAVIKYGGMTFLIW